MKRTSISIFGATGSVGKTALKIIRENKDKFKINVLTSNTNVGELIDLVKEFNPFAVAIADESKIEILKEESARNDLIYFSGQEGVIESASINSDITIAAIVGLAGLKPMLESVKHGGKLCVANKESIVAAGEIIYRECKKYGTRIIPLDSEHNAIFQILEGNKDLEIRKIYLTASGGPFYNFSEDDLRKVKPEDAIKNPNWSMGRKISVDSATLMNKGLEIIEAKHLFKTNEDRIKVLIHRESIAHGIVAFNNNALIGSFGKPDMIYPVRHALFWPKGQLDQQESIDINILNDLSFIEIDENNFISLKLARTSIKEGNIYPIILNASNEVAVRSFLEERISFLDILVVVQESIEYVSKSIQIRSNHKMKVRDIFEVDNEARIKTEEIIEMRH